MLARLKKHWRELAKEPAGKRFQNRHQHAHRAGRKSHRVVTLGVGIALIVVGVVLLVVPGPGSVLIIVGAAFLAEESLVVARILDRIELRLRKVISWALKHWRHASMAARSACIAVAVALVGGAAWLAYLVLMR